MRSIKNKIVTAMLLMTIMIALTACAGGSDVDAAGKGNKDSKESEEERPNATEGIGDPKELSEGDIAPDFTVKLVGGEEFTLSDHDDEVVLINFWATWCPPCVGEMPALQKLYKDGDAVIIGINCGEPKNDVNAFVKDNGYTYNIGYDTDYTISTYYPTDGIPYTLIVNKGVIDKIFIGAYGADVMYSEYSHAIEECLKD